VVGTRMLAVMMGCGQIDNLDEGVERLTAPPH
jgi:hypothetical protein